MDMANPQTLVGSPCPPTDPEPYHGRAKWSSDRPRSITRLGSGTLALWSSSGISAAAGQVGRAAERQVSLPPQEVGAEGPGEQGSPQKCPGKQGSTSGGEPRGPPAEDPVSLWPQDRAGKTRVTEARLKFLRLTACVCICGLEEDSEGLHTRTWSPWVDSAPCALSLQSQGLHPADLSPCRARLSSCPECSRGSARCVLSLGQGRQDSETSPPRGVFILLRTDGKQSDL